jgi:hypothetical protein
LPLSISFPGSANPLSQLSLSRLYVLLEAALLFRKPHGFDFPSAAALLPRLPRLVQCLTMSSQKCAICFATSEEATSSNRIFVQSAY